MKKTILLVLCFLFFLPACSNQDNLNTQAETVVESNTSLETQIPTPTPRPNTRANRVTAVIEEVRALSDSEEFHNSDEDTRIEMAFGMLDTLATVGTEEFPIPLVVEDSFEIRNGSDTQVWYEFIDGGQGLIFITNLDWTDSTD